MHVYVHNSLVILALQLKRILFQLIAKATFHYILFQLYFS